jgi:ATP adenylyltransferase/5',5'''-P-1,P-4-tetraphosphate phosphorylase II
VLKQAGEAKLNMTVSNFTQALNMKAQENATNITNTVERYETYVASILKRLSKRRGIYNDLHNALLAPESSYKQDIINEITLRQNIPVYDR